MVDQNGPRRMINTETVLQLQDFLRLTVLPDIASRTIASLGVISPIHSDAEGPTTFGSRYLQTARCPCPGQINYTGW